MNNPLFSGVCTALVTPFINGQINYPILERLIRRQIQSGITAIVISGTTGESATLSDEEKLTLYQKAKEYAGNDALIIAGTGSNNTGHAVALSCAAENCHVDGLLVVTPYYNKATADGLIQHYSAIANAVHIPVILYNVPSRTGLDIPVNIYPALSQIPNIIGVKEANPDVTRITKIKASCPAGFQIWSGNDDQAVPAISLGASGVISVLSNVLPVQTQAMVQAALAGDFDSAASLQTRLQPLVEALFCEVNPIPVKAAMKMIGYDCGECRLPLTPMKQENLKKLEKTLSEI